MSKKCSACALSLFEFKMIHNGKEEIAYRCMNYHGTPDANGNVRIRKNRKIAQGPRNNFKSCFARLEDPKEENAKTVEVHLMYY